MTIYQEHGYASRREYVESLAEDIGVDVEEALMIAQLLGPSEDFDGLVTTLEDRAEGYM